MKILMVSNTLPEYHKIWGGAEMEAKRVGDMMKELGHDVYYFCRNSDTGAETPDNVFTTKTLEDSIYGKIPYIFDQMKFFGIQNDFIASESLNKVIDEVKPDLVHLHNFLGLSFRMVEEPLRRNIPVVSSAYDYRYVCVRETLYDEHEGLICRDSKNKDCMECLGLKKFLRARKLLLEARKRSYAQLFSKINKIVVLSKNSMEMMKDAGFDEDKLEVINLSFDFSKIKVAEQAIEPGLLLFVGWLQPRKGIWQVLQALKLINKHITTTKLVVFGEADNPAYKAKIEEEIKNSKLESQVELKGRRPNEEVKEYMQKANVVVIAEQWPNMSPLTMVEAMAYKRPVVAGDVGGISEFIEDGKTGLLVKFDDHQDYAEKILTLIRDTQLARRIGESASQAIRLKCDAKLIGGRYQALYEKVLHKISDENPI